MYLRMVKSRMKKLLVCNGPLTSRCTAKSVLGGNTAERHGAKQKSDAICIKACVFAGVVLFWCASDPACSWRRLYIKRFKRTTGLAENSLVLPTYVKRIHLLLAPNSVLYLCHRHRQ